MLDENKCFKFFTNCIPVKGAARSIICDLHRHRIDIIPNSLLDILDENQGKSIKAIKAIYGEENEAIIEEYFNFLINKDYIFLCDAADLDFFPALDMNWEIPSLIENAIIDHHENSQHNYESIFEQLDELGCMALHLRFFTPVTTDLLEGILSLMSHSRLESVDILIPYFENLSAEKLRHWADHYPRLRSMIIHQAPEAVHTEFKHKYLTVIWSETPINSHAHCGMIGPRHFSVNQKLFSESLQFNTCLNHKISIDINGNIKNCPSMKEDFGNIKNTPLSKALNQDGFKKYWTITKNQIDTCKQCEFRHICTDCRAFIENPEDIYSKPLKCGYDPHSNTWESWSTNPLKEKAIAYYQLNELLPAKS